jgi:hypothetical protein
MLIMLSTLKDEVALAGESIVYVDPNRSNPENDALMGDSESGLYEIVERTCGGKSSRRLVSSRSTTGEGGVGVRGGTGMGRLEAIVPPIEIEVPWEVVESEGKCWRVGMEKIQDAGDLEGEDARGYHS